MLTILILATAYGFFRIGRQIYRTYRCVDEATIRAFWSGRLKKNDPDTYREVVTHLGHCDKCQALLEEIRKGKPLEDHLID